MKKTIKRFSVLTLSLLIALSSMPISVLAVDSHLVAIKDSMSAYESKMDGTVYENMQAAFDAYVAAKEAAYAYEYGNKTDIDLDSIADTLSSKTADMTVWTPYKGEAVPSFVNDSSDAHSYDGYAQNILYTVANYDKIAASCNEKTENKKVNAGSNDKHRMSTSIYYPQTVLLYDGETVPTMPVLATSQVTESNGATEVKRRVYSLYTAVAGTNNNDTVFTMKDSTWHGANGETDRNINWRWTMDQDNGYPATYAFDATDEPTTYLQLSTKSTVWVWWTYYVASMANAIQFSGNENTFGSAYSLEKNLNFRRFSGDGNPVDIVEMTAESTSTYVINYKPLRDKISSATSFVAGNLQSLLKKKSDASAILAKVNEATDFDPNDSFKNTDAVRTNVTSCAASIKSLTEGIDSSIATADLSDYNSLASAINKCKDVYDGNNADGKYTADSFASFKSAFETSVAEAANVYASGFTAATTATALLNAYKALNVITPASGSSGSTDYTFDEETGTVTITGPGAMEDYDSADESPFGNNEDITNVIISDDVTYIGTNTFKEANNLTTITVPAAATYGEGAFDDCTKLATVIIIGGEVKNASAPNAPWQQPSVHIVKLGENENDLTVSAIGDNVFTNMTNTAFYFYNMNCDIPDETNATLGSNPTIYGYSPSTAMAYAEKFGYTFISLGHEHVWVVSEIVEATCTKSGHTVYSCKYCDKTKTGDFVSALGHSFDAGTPVPATCTERGYTLLTCERCGIEKKTDYVSSLGHDFSGEIKPNYETGSIKNDSTVYSHNTSCSRNCGSALTDYCSFKVKETEIIDGNSYVVFECDVCKGTYKYPAEVKEDEFNVFFFDVDNNPTIISVKKGQYPTNVPALHPDTEGVSYKWTLDGVEVNPAEIKINDITVFREVKILEVYKVSYYDENGGFLSMENVEYGNKPVNVPALSTTVINLNDNGHQIYAWENDADPSNTVIKNDTNFNIVLVTKAHNFTDNVIEAATCTESGYMTRYCEDCEYFINRVDIDALGHDIVQDKALAATCTTDGLTAGEHCSRCDYKVDQTVIKAAGHKWDGGKITVQPTLSAAGKKVYTCSVCKATKTEELPKLTVADITPTGKEADAAPVNKSINRPKKVRTTSFSKKKQMRVRFSAIAGATNYRVMYRQAGDKKWKYAWTNGKTEYYLKKLKIGGLYEFRFAAYKKNANGKWERGNYSKITRRYYYKHALKSAKAGKSTITLKWKKKKGATAYQVQYGLKKSMKGCKTVTLTADKTSYVITGLKKGKTYYVRVRANKKYKNKNFTGEFSKRLKVKVK